MPRWADLGELKRTHPLPDVVAGYGVILRPSGHVLLVDPRDDHFHCFGCRAHGDLLDFIQRMERVDFRGALERLAQATLPPAITATVAARRPNGTPGLHLSPAARGPAEHACLSVAMELYQRQLLAEPRALAYAASRGLARDTITRYRLGFAIGETLLPELRRRGLPSAAARLVGLLSRSGHEHLAGRLVVPELRAGKPIWLIGRAIAPDCRGRRYLGLPGPKPLLGWEEAVGAATVLVTEGPFDWLTLRQWGYPALALVGTHVRPDVLRSLDRFARLALVFDNDEAGRTAGPSSNAHSASAPSVSHCQQASKMWRSSRCAPMDMRPSLAPCGISPYRTRPKNADQSRPPQAGGRPFRARPMGERAAIRRLHAAETSRIDKEQHDGSFSQCRLLDRPDGKRSRNALRRQRETVHHLQRRH